jgi:hypothetical protein
MILTIPTLILIPFMRVDKDFGKKKKEPLPVEKVTTEQ